MNERDVVEYSVMFQDKSLKKSGWIWDVSPDLDEITADQHVLQLSIKQAMEEDLEVVAMAKANKTVFKEFDQWRTIYTSKFETVDIYAPIFDGIRK
jgi:hypothetical protein